MTDIDALCINTIRTLSIDAVQEVSSGRPGRDPKQPAWRQRDRRVLSSGHASMLDLTKVEALGPDAEPLNGNAVSMDVVKSFRQPGNPTPSHPGSHLATGVEATRGTVIGRPSYGASAPPKSLMSKFRFTPEPMLEVAKERIARHPVVKDVKQAAQ